MCRLGRLLPQATLHFCFVKVYSALLTRTGSPKNPWTLLSTLFSTRKNHFTPHRPRTEEVGAHYPPESFFKLLPTSPIHNEKFDIQNNIYGLQIHLFDPISRTCSILPHDSWRQHISISSVETIPRLWEIWPMSPPYQSIPITPKSS